MAKVVQIQMFEANDGSQFMTAAEADAHDFKLENQSKIDAAAEAFCNSLQKIDRARSMATNFVGEFLAFYIPWIEQGSPEIERTAFDTPKAEKPIVDMTASATDNNAEVIAEEDVSEVKADDLF
ncbi:MAG: hypothetical protein EKE20_14605 [Candidatus Symbiopectobacterium sp. Dall1.0]|nr:hypothetical protein [Candidatus Symbiopectobacterium sp. Dall1.0]